MENSKTKKSLERKNAKMKSHEMYENIKNS